MSSGVATNLYDNSVDGEQLPQGRAVANIYPGKPWPLACDPLNPVKHTLLQRVSMMKTSWPAAINSTTVWEPIVTTRQ